MTAGLRCRAAAALAGVTVAGFALKFYPGPGAFWLNDYAAGMAYVVFFILLLFLIFPRPENAPGFALWIFAMTTLIEFTQLSRHPFLENIRSHFLGRTLIGSDFSWWDIPHYAAGGWIGIRIIRALSRDR